jgi:UDP-N-acetylmuramoylalanine--D-glutamate ligase
VMHPSSDYSGKTILVVGAARSGIAACRFLLKRGAHVILTDTQAAESLETRIRPLRELAAAPGRLELELGGHKLESFRQCDMVIVSPGVPLSLPFFGESRAAGIPLLAEVELAWRHLKGKVLGITGSNGKTTTTTLTTALLQGSGLKAYAAGNIGSALMTFVEQSSAEDHYVTELSSFQLEGIRDFRPAIGTILNLTPDHLDRYTGFEEYVAAKRRIFMNQGKTDYAVLNADDPRTLSLAAEVSSTPVLFSRCKGLPAGCFIRDGRVWFKEKDQETGLFPLEIIGLKGQHNVENVLASCTIALLAGASAASMERVIHDFTGVEHRLEWVADIYGVQFFNDSKATNVDATAKSLEAFQGNIILIAGGRDKGGDFALLRPIAAQRVKMLLLIGEAASKIYEALSDILETRIAKDLPEAVLIANRSARPGDTVLLAPACASFDMFQNYEHRGQVFKESVHALQGSV